MVNLMTGVFPDYYPVFLSLKLPGEKSHAAGSFCIENGFEFVIFRA
ncbi:MAG TPA: hypothetical protein HA272_01125 [Methanoregula sp.]|nr:hypothetical protein [Methanoregula sp.]